MNGVFRVALASLVIWVSTVNAAELRVLSAGAVEPALVVLASAFHRDTGHQVAITFATAPALRSKVNAGEAADVLFAPPAVIDDLVRAGKVLAEDRAVIGRVGVGVAVRAGAPAPDISTLEALKQAVLRADLLVYNEASTGIYFARLLERLGIAGDVMGKTTRYRDGAAVLEHIIKGTGNEIGIGAITEMMAYTSKGLTLVGPLPAEIQNYTTYTASVMAGANSPEVARGFIRYLASPSAKPTFAAVGIE